LKDYIGIIVFVLDPINSIMIEFANMPICIDPVLLRKSC